MLHIEGSRHNFIYSYDIALMLSNRKIILVIILALVVCATAYILLVTIPRHVAEQSYEGARRIGRDVKALLQVTPQITVNSKIIVEQESEVLELASMSRQFHHTYTWTNTRLGSTKKIRVAGTFQSKAGFDLNEKFMIEIIDGKAVVELPEPKILSVELLGDIEFRDEQGLWNWVNAEDRSRAVNAFVTDARRYSEEFPATREVSDAVVEKLIQAINPHVRELEIRIGDEPIHVPALSDPG